MNVGQKMSMNNKLRTESKPEGEWISYQIQHAATSPTRCVLCITLRQGAQTTASGEDLRASPRETAN